MTTKIRVGDRAPTFRLQDQEGREVDLAERIGKKAVVLYFLKIC